MEGTLEQPRRLLIAVSAIVFILLMAVAMFIGNALIYIPGLLWLHQFASGWEQTLQWGITPFLISDALKLVLAALVVPGLWKLIGDARA